MLGEDIPGPTPGWFRFYSIANFAKLSCFKSDCKIEAMKVVPRPGPGEVVQMGTGESARFIPLNQQLVIRYSGGPKDPTVAG